ncbi:MAG: CARDB domain-containing protein [candidate division Zixibacteria bacterium]
MGIFGCAPELPNLIVVEDETKIDCSSQMVIVTLKNIGNKDAGNHLTYLEINAIDANDAQKPQTQYSAEVPAIAKGDTWNSGSIPFSSFSSPRGLDLSTLTTCDLVVRVDAKKMVKESNEDDKYYTTDN